MAGQITLEQDIDRILRLQQGQGVPGEITWEPTPPAASEGPEEAEEENLETEEDPGGDRDTGQREWEEPDEDEDEE